MNILEDESFKRNTTSPDGDSIFLQSPILDRHYELYGHDHYHEMQQFREENPFLEIDFSHIVRYDELIPDKSYISVYKKKIFNYDLKEYEKKTFIQHVIYKEKRVEPEKQHRVYKNTYRYIFTDIYGEPYTYKYPSLLGNGHMGVLPHKINEFEFRHGMITLYEYAEGVPHFK